MAKLRIVRKAFREWLAEHPDLTFERQSSCSCPLAVYLGSGCDTEVFVDSDTTMLDGKTFENPPWVQFFTAAVDEYHGDVTAEQAIAYL